MDGILIVNKPLNCTSHDVVYQVKKIMHEKVGHTGTLDPMAEGVLPLLIGKGTLCSKYLINHDKIYQVTLALGKKTDTADGEGEIIEEEEVREELLALEKVEETLQSFLGKQQQIPPIYSAIKVKGKKLYEYARAGQTVEIKPREIEIYGMKLEKIEQEERKISFIVSCGKGTYIRSLCEDIAKRLGTIGYMCALKRLQVGDFGIKSSVLVEDLKQKQEDLSWLEEQILSIEQFFEEKEAIILPEKLLSPFLNGVKIKQEKPDGIYRVYQKNSFIGIGVVDKQQLKRDIIV